MMTTRRILRLIRVKACEGGRLDVTFDDGLRKVVDVRPLLDGEVFAPLHDPREFARATLDEIAGTVCWPNGADLAPEALRSLPDAG